MRRYCIIPALLLVFGWQTSWAVAVLSDSPMCSALKDLKLALEDSRRASADILSLGRELVGEGTADYHGLAIWFEKLPDKLDARAKSIVNVITDKCAEPTKGKQEPPSIWSRTKRFHFPPPESVSVFRKLLKTPPNLSKNGCSATHKLAHSLLELLDSYETAFDTMEVLATAKNSFTLGTHAFEVVSGAVVPAMGANDVFGWLESLEDDIKSCFALTA